jgi:hypothetical protein
VRKFLHDHVDPGVFAPDAVRTLIAAFDVKCAARQSSCTTAPPKNATGDSESSALGACGSVKKVCCDVSTPRGAVFKLSISPQAKRPRRAGAQDGGIRSTLCVSVALP